MENMDLSHSETKTLIDGYSDLVRQRIGRGWLSYLVSIQFNQIDGPLQVKNSQMQREIVGLYASFLTRLIRKPRSAGIEQPVLIVCPDWPVYKRAKKSLSEVIYNDGLHQHGILLVPPQDRRDRLKIPVDQHFRELQSYYTRAGIMREISVVPFPISDTHKVVDYALKGLKTNKISYDDAVLILPYPHYTRARPYLGKNSRVQSI